MLPRTGPGCNRFEPTCGRRKRRPCGRDSVRAPRSGPAPARAARTVSRPAPAVRGRAGRRALPSLRGYASFLRRAAEQRPFVLVLDDLHAADEPSLLLLQFLARELHSSRILIVGAYRDVHPAPSDALRTTVTELAREPVTTRVLLAGLPQSDVARFIELSAEEAATPEIVSAIHDSTQGNPLFVGEMVRLLAAEGSLADATQAAVVPQTVRDVITGRLRHLSATATTRSSSRQFSDESSRSTRSPGRATSERNSFSTPSKRR